MEDSLTSFHTLTRPHIQKQLSVFINASFLSYKRRLNTQEKKQFFQVCGQRLVTEAGPIRCVL